MKKNLPIKWPPLPISLYLSTFWDTYESSNVSFYFSSLILPVFNPLPPSQHPQTPPPNPPPSASETTRCSPGSFGDQETHALALQLQRDLWRRFSSRAQFATGFGGRSERLKKRLKGLELLSTNPKTVGWFRKSRLTNQLIYGVNLAIFSYIFHVEQGFGAWFLNHQQYERVGHPFPGCNGHNQDVEIFFFVLSLSFFHKYTGKGEGPNPNYALKKASIAQVLAILRFETITKPPKPTAKQGKKKRKRSETSPTRKPFPTLLSMERFPIPTKTEKGNFCIL